MQMPKMNGRAARLSFISPTSVNERTRRGLEVFAKMQPHVLDARGLALLRCTLALHVLLDLHTRYGDGGLASLAWYTSSPEERSILAPLDTPHPHPAHKMWFYRGDVLVQRLLFLSCAATACAFLVGFGCGELGLTSLSLYVQVTALHGRCEAVNDGADRFLRTLLLWSSLLPLSRCWSVDVARRARASAREPARTQLRVASVGALGLTAQHVLMYWGTVAFRWRGSMWWPSGGLSAVHYVLCADFATRSWPCELLISRPEIGRVATALTMLTEALVPALLVLGQCDAGVGGAGLGESKASLASGTGRRGWRAIVAGCLIRPRWLPCCLLAAFQVGRDCH